MSGKDDYCELCDLRKSQCIHGMPKPVADPEEPKAPKTPKAAAPRKPRARAASGVTTKTSPASRRWTPPEDFVPHIVAVLQEADEGLDAEDALTRIEARVADQLRPGDTERSPQGELRWRTAARKARRELVAEGVVDADQPGIWQLKG